MPTCLTNFRCVPVFLAKPPAVGRSGGERGKVLDQNARGVTAHTRHSPYVIAQRQGDAALLRPSGHMSRGRHIRASCFTQVPFTRNMLLSSNYQNTNSRSLNATTFGGVFHPRVFCGVPAGPQSSASRVEHAFFQEGKGTKTRVGCLSSLLLWSGSHLENPRPAKPEVTTTSSINSHHYRLPPSSFSIRHRSTQRKYKRKHQSYLCAPMIVVSKHRAQPNIFNASILFCHSKATPEPPLSSRALFLG